MQKTFIILMLLGLQGCINGSGSGVEMWRSKGFPERHLSYDYMFFLNEQEGYLFGTYAINKPRRETIEVYQTHDGGKSWQKIAEHKGSRIDGYACNTDSEVFLTSTIGRKDRKYQALKFELNEKRFTDSLETQNFGGIWSNNDETYIVTGVLNNRDAILKTNNSLQTIDTLLVDAIGHNYAVFFDHDIYNITRVRTGKNHFFRISDRKSQPIPLTIFPEVLVKQDDGHILLMGSRGKAGPEEKSPPIEVLSYSVHTKKTDHIWTFKDHTIVKDFKSDGQVMTALVGNMGSFFNKYDLAHSLDGGKTWAITVLKEKSYTSPTALIGNTLYMMSGAGRIQKIKLADR